MEYSRSSFIFRKKMASLEIGDGREVKTFKNLITIGAQRHRYIKEGTDAGGPSNAESSKEDEEPMPPSTNTPAFLPEQKSQALPIVVHSNKAQTPASPPEPKVKDPRIAVKLVKPQGRSGKQQHKV